MVRPRHRPATMRTSRALGGAKIRETRLQTLLAIPFVALEPESDIERRALLDLAGSASHSPAECVDVRAAGIGEPQLEVLLLATNDARRSSDRDLSRDQDRRRISNATRLDMSQQ